MKIVLSRWSKRHLIEICLYQKNNKNKLYDKLVIIKCLFDMFSYF